MKDNKPKLYKFSDIEHRLHTLEPGQTYIKPFVTSAVSDTTVSYTHLTLPTKSIV